MANVRQGGGRSLRSPLGPPPSCAHQSRQDLRAIGRTVLSPALGLLFVSVSIALELGMEKKGGD